MLLLRGSVEYLISYLSFVRHNVLFKQTPGQRFYVLSSGKIYINIKISSFNFLQQKAAGPSKHQRAGL